MKRYDKSNENRAYDEFCTEIYRAIDDADLYGDDIVEILFDNISSLVQPALKSTDPSTRTNTFVQILSIIEKLEKLIKKGCNEDEVGKKIHYPTEYYK